MSPVHWKTKLASPARRKSLKTEVQTVLTDWEWQPQSEQYCDWRLDGRQAGHWLRLKQFSNGTLYIEATDESALARVQALLGMVAPSVAPTDGLTTANRLVYPATGGGAASVLLRTTGRGAGQPRDGNLNLSGTYLGTDESGKGDYFGPLVVAGVVVSDETAQALIACGVADCKKLTDGKVIALAERIIAVVGPMQVAFVELTPTIYNQTYDQFKAQKKNLNHLLARAHARVIESLVEKSPTLAEVSPKPVVVDQFGNESLVLTALPPATREGIALTQLPKAEANVGVAAASIIARAKFLAGVQRLSDEIGLPLPLGAGPQVNVAARRLIAAQGRGSLGKVAKLHFKTTQLL